MVLPKLKSLNFIRIFGGISYGEQTPSRRPQGRSPDPFARTVLQVHALHHAHENDACNQFEDCIEITDTDRWLRQKRLEGYKGLGYLHLFIAAYVRMVSMRPGINRFVAGRRIYARNNIEVVLTVRRTMSTTSNETTIKAVFAPTDTIFDVYRKMNEKIDEIKYGGEDNNTEQVAGALLKLPRFLLRFAIGCLRVMDYFGIIPQKLLDASPFHGSMIIIRHGSLGIPPILSPLL